MRYCILSLILLTGLFADTSITGVDAAYREMCLKAATDSDYFQNFRSREAYSHALEVGGGGAFAAYLLKHASKEVMQKLPLLRRLEDFGDPDTWYYPKIGNFSGTTLRYIVIADQIQKLFTLPKNPTIVEIGAGFGGQCYILSQLQSFSKYYIYDLPEVEALIEKMLSTLSVKNVQCLPIKEELPEDKIDLLISNYAYSECDLAMQKDYFERVIKKADRGYMIYNQISCRYGYGSFSPEALLQLLEEHEMFPKMLQEPISTYEGNVLIIWDRTLGGR